VRDLGSVDGHSECSARMMPRVNEKSLTRALLGPRLRMPAAFMALAFASPCENQ
jgi:hypothetical protein